MKKLILLLTLISSSAHAREIGNIYDPSTGQTISINQDHYGNVDFYDPSSGKTLYYNDN